MTFSHTLYLQTATHPFSVTIPYRVLPAPHHTAPLTSHSSVSVERGQQRPKALPRPFCSRAPASWTVLVALLFCLILADSPGIFLQGCLWVSIHTLVQLSWRYVALMAVSLRRPKPHEASLRGLSLTNELHFIPPSHVSIPISRPWLLETINSNAIPYLKTDYRIFP